MTTDDIAEFIPEAEAAFSFLTDGSFVVPEDGRAISPTGSSVTFVGQHVGLMLSYDVKTDNVSCYLLDPVDGDQTPHNVIGFLIHNRAYRGLHITYSSEVCQSDFRAKLKHYVDLIREVLPDVAKDEVTVFTRMDLQNK